MLKGNIAMKRNLLIAIIIGLILIGGILFFTLHDGDSIDSEQVSKTSSSPDAVANEVTLPEELHEIIKANRNEVFPSPNSGLSDILVRYQTNGLNAEKDAAIAELIKQSKNETIATPEYLSHDEIISELDFLFDLLKYGYAGYQYFGGDEVFGAVKQLMLAKLSLMDDQVDNKSYVKDLLAPCLKSVIIDNHFWVGGQQIGVENQLYQNDEYVIHKTKEGFLTEIDGRTYKILSSGGMECSPTITCDGELAWAFTWKHTGASIYQGIGESIELEDVETKEKTTRTISLVRVSSEYKTSLSRDFYGIRDVSGIKILENRRLSVLDENDPQFPFSEFTATGNTLKDEPVMILDLRGHKGGGTAAAVNWIKGYTGKAPSTFALFSMDTLQSKSVSEIYPYLASTSPSQPEWKRIDYLTPNDIQNKNLLIVLMDNSIVSAGESFIALLRQLDNVVFVGTNTAGSLVTGDIGSMQLPVSRQWINLGVTLNIRPDLSQFEGVGFMPDLWVPPGESLDRVIKFIEKYRVAK